MSYKKDISTRTIHSRRDFIKISGLAGTSMLMLNACTNNSLPGSFARLANSQDQVPGIEKWYATCCNACSSNCPVLVKTIDQRPVKIEGNPNSQLTRGGLCAFGQAALFGLYSNIRLKHPMIDQKESTWANIDKSITEKLKASRKGQLILLSHRINSPGSLRVIEKFRASFPNCRHIEYDPISYDAQIEANKKSFGKAVLPDYRINKAKLIVGFNIDFLGTGPAPVESTSTLVNKRDPENFDNHLKVIQFESSLSLTGSKADERIVIKPEDEGKLLIRLYNLLAASLGNQKLPDPGKSLLDNRLLKLSNTLLAAKGQSIVWSGTRSTDIQMIVNGLNAMLENYGRTIDLDNPVLSEKSTQHSFSKLIRDIENEKVSGIIFYNCDPLSNQKDFIRLQKHIEQLELSISISNIKNKTSGLCKYVCPDHHFLESWNDHEPKWNHFHLSQPVVKHLFNSRQGQESLLKWSGQDTSYYDFLKNYWETYFSKADATESSWDNFTKGGLYSEPRNPANKYNFELFLSPEAKRIVDGNQKDDFQFLLLEEKVPFRNGSQWFNPWLNELPDPVSKMTHTPYLMLSPKTAENYALSNGDRIKCELSFTEIALPIIIQKGLADFCFVLALYDYSYIDSSYPNVFEFMLSDAHQAPTLVPIKSIHKLKEKNKLAVSQNPDDENSLYPKTEITEKEYHKLKRDPVHHEIEKEVFKKERHFYPHHWAMVIDLNKCTGCSSCIISCQVENNIPVVGAEQIARNRNMQWLRVERHQKDDRVGFLPVMCQQCDQAPCESVCPVAATSSSREGLNQQNYQKCIGTRFCASNCPYETRRFNYADYGNNQALNPHFTSSLGKNLLNPEVQTREKGTIEKCSFCIQRIQSAKKKAKLKNTPLKDGDVQTACQQSCPAQAIYFGDMNDPSSKVFQLARNKRAFRLFEGLNTAPSVYYLKKVRNEIDS